MLLYVPVEQAVQAERPADAPYQPGLQLMHWLEELAATTAEYVPSSHEVHCSEPRPDAYVPVGHAAQFEFPKPVAS